MQGFCVHLIKNLPLGFFVRNGCCLTLVSLQYGTSCWVRHRLSVV